MGKVIDIDVNRAAWMTVRERCDGCGASSIGVIHARSDFDRLECGYCKQMLSRVVSIFDAQHRERPR